MTARRARLLLWLLLPALLLVACGSDAKPPPPGPLAVSRVFPDRVGNDHESLVLIVGSGFRDGVTVALGPNQLRQPTFINDQLVSAVIPVGVAAGSYPVAVNAPGSSA